MSDLIRPLRDELVPQFCQQCGNPMIPVNTTKTKFVCTINKEHKYYCNPVPVGVAILPIREGGFLLIRRDTDPGKGMVGFPGGNINANESIYEGITRELREETGYGTTPTGWKTYSVQSTPDNQKVLIFAVYQHPAPANFNWRTDSREVSGVIITKEVPPDMAFPLHEQLLRELLSTA